MIASHCVRGHAPEVGRDANGDCLECRRERARAWREANRARTHAWRKGYRARIRAEALLAYGDGSCARCGVRPDDVQELEIDHVNGGGGDHRRAVLGTTRDVGGFRFWRKLKTLGWPNDPPLQTLCADCHKAKSNEERQRDATGRYATPDERMEAVLRDR